MQKSYHGFGCWVNMSYVVTICRLWWKCCHLFWTLSFWRPMARVSHAAVLLTLSCVAHKMTVFDTIANLLEHGINGDVILWNTFMSEMWDCWLVVSAHVNLLTPGMCTAFDTPLYAWHPTHVYAYLLWKPAQDCEWSDVEMFMFYHDSVRFIVGWFIVDFWMLCLA